MVFISRCAAHFCWNDYVVLKFIVEGMLVVDITVVELIACIDFLCRGVCVKFGGSRQCTGTSNAMVLLLLILYLQILDVGCGRGLFLLHMARKVRLLEGGRGTGVDVWPHPDQLNRSRSSAMENARLFGVAEVVKFEHGCLEELAAKSDSCDLVVSAFALHKIGNRPKFEQTIKEMVRICRPGGTICIIDFLDTGRIATLLVEAGLEVRISPFALLFCLPTRTVRATKPILK